MTLYQLARCIPPVFLTAGSSVPEPSILSFDAELVKNLVFIWINVIILVVILALVLYKPVRAFMDNRKAGIQGDLDEAREAREEAKALQAQWEQKVREVEKEREKVLANANKKALERSEAIIKEAREEAATIRKHAVSELQQEREAMELELRRQLIELSVMLAEQFVMVSVDEDAQNRFIDKAIEDWEERLWLE